MTMPMTNTTTIISISVKPRARRAAGRGLLLRLIEIPVADVGIGAFAAFRESAPKV